MIFFDFSLKRKEKSKNSQRKSLKIKIYKNSIKLFKNHLLEASKVNKKSIKGFKNHLLEANKTVHVYAQVHSSIYIYSEGYASAAGPPCKNWRTGLLSWGLLGPSW